MMKDTLRGRRGGTMMGRYYLSIWIMLVIGIRAVAQAGTPAATPPSSSVEYGLAGTVQLETKEKKPMLGSGFFIAPDGYLLTCEHVVAQTATVTVTTAGKKTFEGAVVSRDPAHDLALVKIPARNVPAQVLGDSSTLVSGEAVTALGSPLGLDGTVTSGVVSNPSRTVGNQTLIQTDVSVNPGLSGGPLLNGKGQVIGVIAARVQQAEGVGFAVPINNAIELINKANIAVNVVPSNTTLAFAASATKAIPSPPAKVLTWQWWHFLVGFIVLVGLVVLVVLLLQHRRGPIGEREVNIALRSKGRATHARSAPPAPPAENLDDIDIELH